MRLRSLLSGGPTIGAIGGIGGIALALVLGSAPAEGSGLVTSPDALAARSQGSVTVLDARPDRDYARGHLPGALPIDWTDFRAGWGRTGKLPADLDEVARRLSAMGVDAARPVVVYGRAREGWGEEGRIVWMLAYLGHTDVALLDGGFATWVAAGHPVSTEPPRPLPGRFTSRPVSAWRASGDDVERARQGAGVVLDVRTVEEWRGERPYFEARGGHVPGARHLEWKELLDARGRLDPEAAKARLRSAGVDPAKPVILYCTGGVRSAEAWVILRQLGYADVRNYDGSWFEWSADDRRPVELSPSENR